MSALPEKGTLTDGTAAGTADAVGLDKGRALEAKRARNAFYADFMLVGRSDGR